MLTLVPCTAMGLILEAAAEEATARSDASTSDSETEGLRQRRPGDADVLAQEPLWVPPRRVRAFFVLCKECRASSIRAAILLQAPPHFGPQGGLWIDWLSIVALLKHAEIFWRGLHSLKEEANSFFHHPVIQA